jgi:hypothetical protein
MYILPGKGKNVLCWQHKKPAKHQGRTGVFPEKNWHSCRKILEKFVDFFENLRII